MSLPLPPADIAEPIGRMKRTRFAYPGGAVGLRIAPDLPADPFQRTVIVLAQLLRERGLDAEGEGFGLRDAEARGACPEILRSRRDRPRAMAEAERRYLAERRASARKLGRA